MSKTKSIAFCGLITALHVIATIILKFEFIPGIELFILFFIPFLSSMISLKTNFKYSLIFSIASLIICCIIDLQVGFLYILPTISVGLSYGLCVKKDLDGSSIVYILTVLEFGLFFVSTEFLTLFYDIDVLEQMQEILHFTGSNSYLGLGFLLIYSFAQAFMVHIVAKSELKKIKINVKKTTIPSFFNICLSLIGFLAIFLPVEEESLVFFLAIEAIIFSVPLALYGYQATEKPYIILAVQAGVFLVGTLPMLNAIENSSINYENIVAYLLLFIPPMAYALYKIFIKPEEGSFK